MPSEDAKPVRKDEAKDNEADNKSLSSIIRKKPNSNAASSTLKSRTKEPLKVKKEEFQANDDDDFDKPIKIGSSGSRSKEARVKKDEADDDEDDYKPISKNNSAKTDKKELKKNKKGEEKKEATSMAEQNGRKRERKVYDLPGQKRDPPEERDPLRIFYESLYEQIPNSEMAQIWMMESGLLPLEEAREVFEKKKQKNQLQKFSSPTKPVSAVRSSTKTVTVSSTTKKTTETKVPLKQTKKRGTEDEDDSDDDFLVNRVMKKQKSK